jgi:oligoendopeptidase F
LAAQLETRDQVIQGLRKQTQILTEAYKTMEERMDTKDQEILELKEQMSKMQQEFQSSYDNVVHEVLEKIKPIVNQTIEL